MEPREIEELFASLVIGAALLLTAMLSSGLAEVTP